MKLLNRDTNSEENRFLTMYSRGANYPSAFVILNQ